jgi:prepilin-type N-terminal cleavage/methylation domain-containing protein
MALPSFSFRGRRWNSFTLIELLVVICIIAILAALTLAAAEAVMNKGARSRASAEMQAMSAAMESYKADNGVYLWTNSAIYPAYVPIFTSTNDYIATDPSSVGGTYTISAQLLYEGLSGKTNFEDPPVAGVTKSYMNFKANQLGGANAPAGAYSASGSTCSTYVQDPWGYAYGYYYAPSSANASASPYNGLGFFDLWSTGGSLLNTSGGFTNTWISNWSPP